MDSITSIIPKITSPLAVICFCFYIFYLYKQSSDRKKEKTLTVGNEDAQKDAVKKILSDYPDIEINPITDPVGALELAKTIVHDKLAKYQKTLNFLLLFVLIFALTFLMSLAISNNNILQELLSNNSKSWAEKNTLIKGKTPYSIMSIMGHIQLLDSITKENKSIRKAYFRYFYTLKAVEDINIDQNVFREQYSTNSARVTPWAGTELQVIEAISENQYWVKFAAKKNEVITIATGANYSYDNSNSESGDAGCFGEIDLNKDEWFTCYPNTLDYIDKLSIMIEGINIDTNLPPSAAYRKLPNGTVNRSEGVCKVFLKDKKCTLIAKWTNIGPGECVGFKVGCKHLVVK